MIMSEKEKNDQSAGVMEAHPNFVKFTEEEFKALLSYFKSRVLAKDELLFREGEPGQTMCLLKSGEVRVVKAGFSGEAVITKIVPGEIVGEMAVIDGINRSASVRASVASELMEIDVVGFNKLKKENPQVAIKMMELLLRMLTSRLRITTMLVL
jgi:CRP-like cAMP-binding protein